MVPELTTKKQSSENNHIGFVATEALKLLSYTTFFSSASIMNTSLLADGLKNNNPLLIGTATYIYYHLSKLYLSFFGYHTTNPNGRNTSTLEILATTVLTIYLCGYYLHNYTSNKSINTDKQPSSMLEKNLEEKVEKF